MRASASHANCVSGANARGFEYRDLVGALFEEITQILEKYTKRRQE
jgi:hypothetical protein